MNTRTTAITVLFVLTLFRLAFANPFLSEHESRILAEMNLMRSNPGLYAEKYIVPMLNRSDNGTFVYPSGARANTIEGVAVIRDCIEQMKNSPSVPFLVPSRGMSNGARDQVNFQAGNGQVGHAGQSGLTPGQRANQYGRWSGKYSENIHYGLTDPRDIIISLLIDDGVSNRGHRNVMLSGEYSQAGIHYGRHPHYRYMCVITYAVEYVEN